MGLAMSSGYFLALRDQGANLWLDVEKHRLAQVSQLKTKTRNEKWLRISAGISGAIAGVGGSQLIHDLGSIGGWVILLVGLIPGICAVLSPSEEITKASERAEQLAALKMEIYEHIERMRVAPKVSVPDVQFMDRKRQEFVAGLLEDKSDVSAFQAQAEMELDKMNFHRLEYIGASEAEEAETSQDASDEIAPFAVGA